MRKKLLLSNILQCLGPQVLKVIGPVDDICIDNLADVEHTIESTLDWINPNKNNAQDIAERTKARVILVGNNVVYSEAIMNSGKTLVFVKNPKEAIAIVGNSFFVRQYAPGIHPTAIIDDDAVIGDDVYIGPYAVVGKATIGEGTVISSQVRIYDDVVIGNHCFIKEGAVIGGAGFGFEYDDKGNRFRFPQLGGVIIGDYVEIGGNTCIDRGALSNTIIKDYAKIDNLCHIAHNVIIGKNTMVIACAEISGSCVIGDNVWIGPNSSVRDWKKVDSNTLVGIGSVVVKNIPSDEVWAGNPAKKF